MRKPRLADLCSGAGGAAVGYARAGFEVVGVDLRRQPEYPFEFHRGDALRFSLRGFDAVHASPPCQGWTPPVLASKALHLFPPHADLVGPMREKLEASGLPYVIENVPRAPVRRDVRLCGSAFGLGVVRHRVFELGRWTVDEDPPPCDGCRNAIREGRAITVAGNGGGLGLETARKFRAHRFPGLSIVDSYRRALGIDHVTNTHNLAEAIPPAFTEWIGRRLLAHLGAST